MCLFPFRNKVTLRVFICVVILFYFFVFIEGQLPKNRVKRQVVFTKSSKFFFRLNGKLNSLNSTEVVACGYTCRVNFDLPSTVQKRYKFFKRDIHSEVEAFTNESSLRGFSCILKHFCQLLTGALSAEQCGFFCEISKILTRGYGNEGTFFNHFLRKCKMFDNYNNVCPHRPDEPSIFSYGKHPL